MNAGSITEIQEWSETQGERSDQVVISLRKAMQLRRSQYLELISDPIEAQSTEVTKRNTDSFYLVYYLSIALYKNSDKKLVQGQNNGSKRYSYNLVT